MVFRLIYMVRTNNKDTSHPSVVVCPCRFGSLLWVSVRYPDTISPERMIRSMQNISWNLFSATGNIDAYLLYKDYQRVTVPGEDDAELSMDVEENEG